MRACVVPVCAVTDCVNMVSDANLYCLELRSAPSWCLSSVILIIKCSIRVKLLGVYHKSIVLIYSTLHAEGNVR